MKTGCKCLLHWARQIIKLTSTVAFSHHLRIDVCPGFGDRSFFVDIRCVEGGSGEVGLGGHQMEASGGLENRSRGNLKNWIMCCMKVMLDQDLKSSYFVLQSCIGHFLSYCPT